MCRHHKITRLSRMLWPPFYQCWAKTIEQLTWLQWLLLGSISSEYMYVFVSNQVLNSVLFLTYFIILLLFPIFAALPNNTPGKDDVPCLFIHRFSINFFNFGSLGVCVLMCLIILLLSFSFNRSEGENVRFDVWTCISVNISSVWVLLFFASLFSWHLKLIFFFDRSWHLLCLLFHGKSLVPGSSGFCRELLQTKWLRSGNGRDEF